MTVIFNHTAPESAYRAVESRTLHNKQKHTKLQVLLHIKSKETFKIYLKTISLVVVFEDMAK